MAYDGQPAGGAALRFAEAAGVLALATDLAMGQPLEHGLRTAIIGTRIAADLGLDQDAQQAIFYTGLLHFAGCTADSQTDAGFFGDEMAARPQMMAAFLGPRRAWYQPPSGSRTGTVRRSRAPRRWPSRRSAASPSSASGPGCTVTSPGCSARGWV